jgi:integrase
MTTLRATDGGNAVVTVWAARRIRLAKLSIRIWALITVRIVPIPDSPPHARHSTGYKLANDGHDTRALQHYMGHKNIMHTVRYTEMAPDRFKNFWKD